MSEALKNLQTKLYKAARAAAGPRYSEEVHVGLPISAMFEGLGRTDEFYDRYKELKLRIRKECGREDLFLFDSEKDLQKKIKQSFESAVLSGLVRQ